MTSPSHSNRKLVWNELLGIYTFVQTDDKAKNASATRKSLPADVQRDLDALDEDEGSARPSTKELEEEPHGDRCAICLNPLDVPEERCCLLHCMHAFHYSCGTRWLDFKRQCPLCKRPVAGIIYDIRSDETYQTRMFPKEEEDDAGPRWTDHERDRDRDRDRERTQVTRYEFERPHPRYRHPADVADERDRERERGRPRDRDRWASRGSRWGEPHPPSRPARDPAEPQQPNPYYFRVQRMLGGTRDGQRAPYAFEDEGDHAGPGPSSAPAAAQASLGAAPSNPYLLTSRRDPMSIEALATHNPQLALRRAVYLLDLQPAPPPGPPPPRSAAATAISRWGVLPLRGSVSASVMSVLNITTVETVSPNARYLIPDRVRAFAERELQAATGSEQVDLLLTLVLSLMEAHGLSNDRAAREWQAAMAALAPFLGESRAVRLWTELRRFAESGLSLALYDARTQYLDPPAFLGRVSQPAVAAATGPPPPPPVAADGIQQPTGPGPSVPALFDEDVEVGGREDSGRRRSRSRSSAPASRSSRSRSRGVETRRRRRRSRSRRRRRSRTRSRSRGVDDSDARSRSRSRSTGRGEGRRRSSRRDRGDRRRRRKEKRRRRRREARSRSRREESSATPPPPPPEETVGDETSIPPPPPPPPPMEAPTPLLVPSGFRPMSVIAGVRGLPQPPSSARAGPQAAPPPPPTMAMDRASPRPNALFLQAVQQAHGRTGMAAAGGAGHSVRGTAGSARPQGQDVQVQRASDSGLGSGQVDLGPDLASLRSKALAKVREMVRLKE